MPAYHLFPVVAPCAGEHPPIGSVCAKEEESFHTLLLVYGFCLWACLCESQSTPYLESVKQKVKESFLSAKAIPHMSNEANMTFLGSSSWILPEVWYTTSLEILQVFIRLVFEIELSGLWGTIRQILSRIFSYVRDLEIFSQVWWRFSGYGTVCISCEVTTACIFVFMQQVEWDVGV